MTNEKKLLLLELGWTEEMIIQFITDDLSESSENDFFGEQVVEGTILSINYDSINASTSLSFLADK